MVQTRSATKARAAATIRSKRKAAHSVADEPPAKKESISYIFPPKKAVPRENWKFGYDKEGILKIRIIVTFKDQQGTWVHQYDREPELQTTYYCYGCFTHKETKNIGMLCAEKEIFWAPTDHKCLKFCAKHISEVQAKKEKESLHYSGELVPTTSIPPRYTFTHPRYQEFSFQVPLIRYLICHPKNSAAYDNLQGNHQR